MPWSESDNFRTDASKIIFQFPQEVPVSHEFDFYLNEKRHKFEKKDKFEVCKMTKSSRNIVLYHQNKVI